MTDTRKNYSGASSESLDHRLLGLEKLDSGALILHFEPFGCSHSASILLGQLFLDNFPPIFSMIGRY